MENENKWLVQKGFRIKVFFTLFLLIAGNLHAVAVKEFGVVGDGKTDDAAAFQKAIDRAAAQNEPLEIGEGRFFLGSDLVIEKPIVLRGEGHDRSVFTSNGGKARVFVGASGTEFHRIGFEEMIEPIALDSRADYVLENLLFQHCRFEKILIAHQNRGAIGLSSGSAGQRPFRIENLTIRECLFRNIDAHAINIRANISGAKIERNIFLDLVNDPTSISPEGGYAIRLGDSTEHGKPGKYQGNHLISENQVRGLAKSSVEGNLKAFLIYGDHNTIDNNRIEGVDATAEGMDANAMYIRGSFNRIVSNVIRNIRGADDDGALSLKGGMANGNQGNIIAWNVVEKIDGMSAVEVSTTDLLFFENEIHDAPTRGFYHRTGKNVSITDNLFTNADLLLRTSEGTALISGNQFLESRLLLEQRRAYPSSREKVIIETNHFQRLSEETQTPLIRLGNQVREKEISLRKNSLQNLAKVAGNDRRGAVIDLVSGGTVERVEMIGNFFDHAGSESLLLRIGSSVGEGRFTQNTIALRNLQGPFMKSAFKTIDSNTIHIPVGIEEKTEIPALFVVEGHEAGTVVYFRNNRIVNESKNVRIGSLIQVEGEPVEIRSEQNVVVKSWAPEERRSAYAPIANPRIVNRPN